MKKTIPPLVTIVIMGGVLALAYAFYRGNQSEIIYSLVSSPKRVLYAMENTTPSERKNWRDWIQEGLKEGIERVEKRYDISFYENEQELVFLLVRKQGETRGFGPEHIIITQDIKTRRQSVFFGESYYRNN